MERTAALVAGQLGERSVHLVGDALVFLLLVDQFVCGARAASQHRLLASTGVTPTVPVTLQARQQAVRAQSAGTDGTSGERDRERGKQTDGAAETGAVSHAAETTAGSGSLVGGHLREGGVQLVGDGLKPLLLVHQVVCNSGRRLVQRRQHAEAPVLARHVCHARKRSESITRPW